MEKASDVNMSISSWKTEDMNSDVDEFKNNVNKFTLEPIEERKEMRMCRTNET